MFLTVLFGLTASFYLQERLQRRHLLQPRSARRARRDVRWSRAFTTLGSRRKRYVIEICATPSSSSIRRTWTALIYVTGGAASGATALYGLTCLAGAILIGPRGPFVAAIAGAVFFSLLCAGFVSGRHRPAPRPAAQPLCHRAR